MEMERKWRAGDKVVVANLQIRTTLNGAHCTVVSNARNGRVRVRADHVNDCNEREVYWLLPETLAPRTAASDTAGRAEEEGCVETSKDQKIKI